MQELFQHMSNISKLYLTMGEQIDGGDGVLFMEARIPCDDHTLDPHSAFNVLNLEVAGEVASDRGKVVGPGVSGWKESDEEAEEEVRVFSVY
jgi:hypothetical protein